MIQEHLVVSKHSFSDDGFTITAAEPWIKVKVQVIQHYFQSFIENVSAKVDDIVFIDLYSGSGLYSIGHQKEVFPGISLLSLANDYPISKWILCEEDSNNAKALKIRINKFFRGKNILILEGRPENLIDKFKYFVPQSKGRYKVATFCVVDPFSLETPFDVIRSLNDLGVSFIVPFTFALNNLTNHKHYVKNHTSRLNQYLGTNEINKLAESKSNQEFYKRVVKIYQNNMLMSGLSSTLTVHKISSALMDLPQYYMGYFSRQLSPRVIHREVLTKGNFQYQLFK